MSESAVLAEVEQKYGTLEDFVLHVLMEIPEVLDNEWNLEKKARETGLSSRSLAFLLNRSTRFRQLIRSDLVNQEFNLLAERQHVQEVVKIARNEQITRLSPSGEAIPVDQNPSDLLKAGEYLNKYRNTPLDGGPKQNYLGFQVVFSGNGSEMSVGHDSKTIEVEASGGTALPSGGYRPGRAGDTPPAGVRGRYEAADGGAKSASPAGTTGELDFYSREAEEKARDQEIAERTSGEKARDRAVDGPRESRIPVGNGASGNEVLRASLRNLKRSNHG